MAAMRNRAHQLVSEPIDSAAAVEEESPQDPVDNGIRGLAPDLEWRRSHQILNERVVILEKQVKDLASQTSQIPLILAQLQLLTQRMGKFQSNQESSQVVSPSKSNASGKPQLNLGRGSMEENLGSLQKNGECAPSVRSYGREKSMVQSSQSSQLKLGDEEIKLHSVEKSKEEYEHSNGNLSRNRFLSFSDHDTSWASSSSSSSRRKVFPLLIEKISFKEQASLVWQLLKNSQKQVCAEHSRIGKRKHTKSDSSTIDFTGIVCWLPLKDVGYSSTFFIFDPGGRSWCPKLRSLLCCSLELGLELKELPEFHHSSMTLHWSLEALSFCSRVTLFKEFDCLLEDADQYLELYKRSVEDSAGFWSDIADEFHWEWKWNPEEVYTENLDVSKGPIKIEWFKGGLTNICYNALDRNIERGIGDKIALYWEEAELVAMMLRWLPEDITVHNDDLEVNAYVEWAPVPDLAKYGLIHGYYDSAMSIVFEILMSLSQDYLERSSSSVASIDESEFEFVECICECMVALGSSNMQCISGDAVKLSKYLQLMLGYFQHFKFVLHFHSLNFWLVVLRESVFKPKAPVVTEDNNLGIAIAQVDNEKEKRGISAFINDDVCAVILDVSFQRMLKEDASPGTTASVNSLELWSDEFDEKSEFSQYRAKLLGLIRHVAVQTPVVATARMSQRIIAIITSPLSVPIAAQDLALMESMQLGLETIVSSAFDGPADFSCTSESKFQLHRILEGLLQQFISLKWTEPARAELLGRFLDALGPYLKYSPDAISLVVNKLFELLTSLPCTLTAADYGARHARLQICTSFIRIARAADKSLLPHMKGIADTMAYLQGEGRLLRGEHNLLGEAFLIMASSAGVQQQQEVLTWLLEPLSKQWVQLEWQNAYLSDPFGLARLCSDTQFMWNLYHTVTFFEKSLKRSGNKKPSWNILQPHSSASESSTHSHPMSSHLSWMLPPLLKLLRSVHSFWSEPVSQALSIELKAAKSMNQAEQATLLGERNRGLKDVSQLDMNREGESNRIDIRNWLKGIRDSGYNVIGLSTTVGDHFFRCIESSSVAVALMENIQSMEFRHIRLLIHLVIIPLVKFCPPDSWGQWLVNLLNPLFLHCHQALSCSWTSLLHEGRAKVPDNLGNLAGLELKVEVMEEKLLRDLTREVCYLLSTLALPFLNVGLSLEQLGHSYHMVASSPKDLEAFAATSVIGFFMTHQGPALPALRLSIEVFSWTDSEAVSKIISFCGPLIALAALTNNKDLSDFVAKDLFCAIIRGLALESNAVISSDLVGLCRDIYVHLLNRDPSPRQVLLSLGCSQENLRGFEDSMLKTSSSKEQKQLMRSFLQHATGNNLKALAAQKSINVITNVTARTRPTTSISGPHTEDDGLIGLAAIS